MVLLLLKLLFWALGSLTSLATLAFFRTVALVAVVFIQAFRVPGLVVEAALEQTASLLRTMLGLVLELVKDGIASLVSAGFELVSDTATGSISLTTPAIMEAVEKTKSVVEGLAEIFPEIFGGMSDMACKVVLGLWDNYMDAP